MARMLQVHPNQNQNIEHETPAEARKHTGTYKDSSEHVYACNAHALNSHAPAVSACSCYTSGTRRACISRWQCVARRGIGGKTRPVATSSLRHRDGSGMSVVPYGVWCDVPISVLWEELRRGWTSTMRQMEVERSSCTERVVVVDGKKAAGLQYGMEIIWRYQSLCQRSESRLFEKACFLYECCCLTEEADGSPLYLSSSSFHLKLMTLLYIYPLHHFTRCSRE